MSVDPSQAAALDRLSGILALQPEEDPSQAAIEAVAERPAVPSSQETDEPESPPTPGEQVAAAAGDDLDSKLEPQESYFASLLGPEPEADDDDEDDDGEQYAAVSDDEPDDDDEPAATDEDEWEPPEMAAMRKRLAKAEKEAERQKQLRVQSSAKAWKEEAKRRYPLADVESVQADSKRAFMRAAEKSHLANRKIVGPLMLEAEKSMRAAIRAEYEQAWGTPMEGAGSVPVTAAAHQKELEDARKSGDLTKVIGVLRKFASGGG